MLFVIINLNFVPAECVWCQAAEWTPWPLCFVLFLHLSMTPLVNKSKICPWFDLVSKVYCTIVTMVNSYQNMNSTIHIRIISFSFLFFQLSFLLNFVWLRRGMEWIGNLFLSHIQVCLVKNIKEGSDVKLAQLLRDTHCCVKVFIPIGHILIQQFTSSSWEREKEEQHLVTSMYVKLINQRCK